MPALQTSYAGVLQPGYPGMIADMRNRTVLSFTSQSPNAMAFGVPVMRGSSDNTCLNIGDTGAGAFIGVSVIDPAVRPQGNNSYLNGDTVGAMTKGPIWVTVVSATTPGVPAFYTAAGAFTATATGNTAIPNGAFETTAASGGLAILRVS